MKKAVFITSFVFLVICLVAGVYFFVVPTLVHRDIIDEVHAYEPYSVTSHDGGYILQTVRFKDETGVYANFVVLSSTTEEIVFECPEKYRTMDLKSIDWAASSNNIVVISGDVGTITYSFSDGEWIKR